MLVGGGYRSPISENASLVAIILYDVIRDPRSPYYSSGGLSYRIGLNIGF